MNKSFELAEVLATVTREVPWQLYIDEIRGRYPGATLRTRVGAGRKTYCRPDGGVPLGFTITYGRGMVEHKLSGVAEAASWLSAEELVTHDFLDGEVTPSNLMAHTIIHEFAHLLHFAADQGPEFGRSHDAAFRAHLKRLYRDGVADLVKEAIEAACGSRGIALPEFESAEATTSALSDSRRPTRLTAMSLHIGDVVEFDYEGRIHRGTVRRRNPKRATVVPDQRAFPGQYWRVPYSWLRRSTGQPSQSSSLPAPPRPTPSFRIGNRVSFTDKDSQPQQGEVLRVNQKTCSVRVDGDTKYPYWLIPKRMLRVA